MLLSGVRESNLSLFQDSGPVKCVSFHPLGNFIIAATTHPVIRMYDVTTGCCFVCPNPRHQHTKQVNSLKWVYCFNIFIFCLTWVWTKVSVILYQLINLTVVIVYLYIASRFPGRQVSCDEHYISNIIFSVCVRFSTNGRLFASAGADGHIKLWDGVSNRCINTFTAAHDGAEVSSICFTRNNKVCLSQVLRQWVSVCQRRDRRAYQAMGRMTELDSNKVSYISSRQGFN